MWCDASGHHVLIPAVKTSNARSGGACTRMLWRTATPSACSIILCLLLLGCIAKRGQRLVPERVEVGPQVGHGLRIHAIHPPRADLAIDHQPGVLEDLEMLRDRRPADREARGQLADRSRDRRQALEDGLARRVAEGGHGSSYVSHG